MIKLIEPSEEYLESYMEAYDEYEAEHITRYPFEDARSCDIFAKYDNYRYERNLKPNRVGADYFWLVDDDNIGSARVMVHNGLVLQDKIENVIEGEQIVTRRYWKDL